MDRSTLQREKRLAELKKEVTRRGFDRHASVLKAISELPVELKSPSITEIAAQETIQTIVVFPPQIQRGWNYVPKQALLFTSTGVIHSQASIWPGEAPQVTVIKGCDLMALKVTLVLLYGYIEIVARGSGSPTRLGMEFNTVAWPCLSTPVRQLLIMSRIGLGMSSDMDLAATIPPPLDVLPLKFTNGARIHGRLPGQAIEALAFQPSVSKPWLYFLRRKVLANTLLLLTTDFLVLVQEELKVEQGWVLTYIPRACIVQIQDQPRGTWTALTLCLKRHEQTFEHTLLLENETARDWRSEWIQHGGRWEHFAA